MKDNCSVIKDLLPLYIENITSEESKKAVEEHLKNCKSCRSIFKNMQDNSKETLTFNNESDQMFQNYVKAYNRRSRVRTAIFVVIAILITLLLEIGPYALNLVFSFMLDENKDILVDTDVANYEKYMGKNALDDFVSKSGMKEDIFPEKITTGMKVDEYKMVYYNPFDPQWLSYLVVEYNNDDYQKELERLRTYPSTKYLGYYGVTGFDNDYELIAMQADSYNGFVYALDAHDGKIVYVEIIFSNYQMDIYYPQYIATDYLPEGFDATTQNPYALKNQ